MLKLIDDKYKTISIIGMAKNSGKTVALNHLISQANMEGIAIGITSIGRDGETLDIVTETDKPPIFLEENTLIATTTEMLKLGDATMEILKVTDYRTPLGEIIIGRVKSQGYMQIAGPQRLSEIKAVSDIMLNLGVKFVIIDGAINRLSQAAPSISEATILSTGAVLSRDMDKVMEKTIYTKEILGLPEIDENQIKEEIRRIIDGNKIATIDKKNEIEILPIKTALSQGHIIGEYLNEDIKYLIIPGSLVKKTLEDITRTTNKYKDIEIIIKDSTKIFIESKDWKRFAKQGIKVIVLDKINLIGITLNPYAPQGHCFEPEYFLKKMRTYIDDIPVMDLIGGE